MTNNYSTPFYNYEGANGLAQQGQAVEIVLGNSYTIDPTIYSIGSLQIHHELIVACSASPDANVGAVLEESALRREFGTWHREKDGAIDERFVIEHPIQRFRWAGERYPLSRSDAADPGRITLADGLLLDYVLDSNALLKVEPASLTLLAVPNPNYNGNSTVPQYLYRRPVPQYYLDKSCFRLKPQGEKLTLNFFQPTGYKPLAPVELFFDSDRIVIRPFPFVDIQFTYNSYIIICSDDRTQTEYSGGSSFGVCIPLLPSYPPEEPPQVVTTSP